jgi:hypothetical protein
VIKEIRKKVWNFRIFSLLLHTKDANIMKEGKPYPHIEEEDGSCLKACEAAVALTDTEVQTQPDDVDYAHIVNGVLQVTPDIEEEIAAVERGETVSMGEFKTMFARWL